MSTSLLYHALCIRGYQYVATVYRQGRVLFRIRRERDQLRCPACGSPEVVCRGKLQREFRSVPIGRKPVAIQLDVQRVQCRQCGCLRQERLGFAEPQRRHTRAFERYVVDLSKSMTLLDLARHLQVGWDTVKDILKRHLSRRCRRVRLRDLRQIAIDEIAIAKGHKYLTIVLDLLSGAVVFVGAGKGAAALAPFWRRLRRSRARIEAVASDMSPAHIQAVSTHLPQATLVFDHFHIIQLFNDKLSDLRRELHREATDKLHKDALKGTRWLLLKAAENLDESRNEAARLAEALELNQPLATAYYLEDRRGPQGGLASVVGTGRPGPGLPGRLARARGSQRRHHPAQLGKDAGRTPQGHPGLLRLSDLHGPSGRHQQQDQDTQTPSLWLPRLRVLQAQDPRSPRDQVRISRMNPFFGTDEAIVLHSWRAHREDPSHQYLRSRRFHQLLQFPPFHRFRPSHRLGP